MTESIYHTTNSIPLLGLIISLILISGFYSVGEITIKYFGLKEIIQNITKTKYQNILIGVNVSILVCFPIVLWVGKKSNSILLIFSYLIFFLGLLNIIKSYKKILNIKKKIKIKTSNIVELLVYLSIILYFLISAAPVTNADSIDYHLQIGKKIAENGVIPLSLNHFHSHLFGNGEVLIAIGILAGTEQLSSIVQFSGLLSILGIIRHNNKNKNDYSIYLLSSPILIFFISSIKPQFFFIASTTFVFALLLQTKLENNSLNFKKYTLSFLLLCIASQAKFSFMLSLGILGTYAIFDSLRNKIFLKTLAIFALIFFFTVFSTILWKNLYYQTHWLQLFINPFPVDDLGLNRFKNYLVNAGKGGNMLKGIIFPDGLSDLTNSIGLAPFLIFILLKKIKKNLEPIFLIFIFIILALMIGQPSSRFLFEPFVWVLITLSKNDMYKYIGNIFDKILKFQFILFLPAIIYGGIALFPGVISDTLKDRVMEKNSNGYSFYKWSNRELDKLKYNGTVISLHRSISLLKENKFISKDFVYFTDIDKKMYSKYLKEIKDLNPKYIITPSYSITYAEKYFRNCNMILISKKKNVGRHTSRKPFSQGSFYDGLIFQIDSKKMPECVLAKE